MKSYRIDPALVSLEAFRKLTAGKDMLPGRTMLREQIEGRFAILEQSGMRHLGDLLAKLSTKAKILEYSWQTGLPAAYLVLLKREAGSYLVRPFPLSDFPGLPLEYTELLKSRGLRHTRDFFEKVQGEKQQAELAAAAGIPVYRLKEMHSLCDLSRITWVGGIFARVLYEAGIRSVEDFAGSDPAVLPERCHQIIEKYGYAAGKLGEKDIRYGINYAKVIMECDQNIYI